MSAPTRSDISDNFAEVEPPGPEAATDAPEMTLIAEGTGPRRLEGTAAAGAHPRETRRPDRRLRRSSQLRRTTGPRAVVAPSSSLPSGIRIPAGRADRAMPDAASLRVAGPRTVARRDPCACPGLIAALEDRPASQAGPRRPELSPTRLSTLVPAAELIGATTDEEPPTAHARDGIEERAPMPLPQAPESLQVGAALRAVEMPCPVRNRHRPAADPADADAGLEARRPALRPTIGLFTPPRPLEGPPAASADD
jgi:hypothetical protein